MDPTMLAAIATEQMAEYLDELDRERDLRRHYGRRRAPSRRSWLGRLIHRSVPRTARRGERCGESARETC